MKKIIIALIITLFLVGAIWFGYKYYINWQSKKSFSIEEIKNKTISAFCEYSENEQKIEFYFKGDKSKTIFHDKNLESYHLNNGTMSYFWNSQSIIGRKIKIEPIDFDTNSNKSNLVGKNCISKELKDDIFTPPENIEFISNN